MISGINEIFSKLNQFTQSLKRRVLKALAIEAEKSKDLNFEAGGRPKWEKKFIDDGNPVLLKSGKLQQQTTAKIDFEADKIEIGNTLIYGRVQQEGATITITVKMRKFFWAKYFETENKKWMMLALTSKETITIKPRPYILIPPMDYGRVTNTLTGALQL